MKIFTPGHSTYTDTLILYGICKAIHAYFEDEFKGDFVRASKMGQQYQLEIKADVKDLVKAFVKLSHDQEDTMYAQLTDRRSPLGLFSENDVKEALETLRDEKGLRDYISDLIEPGHPARRREGRGGHGKTIKLPLMPLAGKYQHKDLTLVTKYPSRFYKACRYCRALALTGFLNATYPVIGRQGRVIIVISFEGLTDSEYFSDFFTFHPAYWSEFFEELRRAKLVDQLPVRTIMFIVVSLFSADLIDAMARAEANWRSVGIRFAGRPGAPEIRGFCELEFTSFVYGLNKLYKSGIPGLFQISGLIRLLASQGDADSLDSLFKFVSSADIRDTYGFVRGAYSAIQRAKLQKKGWKSAYEEFYNYFQNIARIVLGG